MKTYLINAIKKVSVNSQSLDLKSAIKAHEWIVFNEDKSFVEKFLFIDNEKLLVSVNGKSTYSKWKYIKVNSSLIIEDEINKYLLKILVCNKDIIVLNVDSTNKYSFLINANSSILKDATYETIQWYLVRICGIDILTDEQREQFAEEKRIEENNRMEKERKEEQEKEEFFNVFFSLLGIMLVIFIIYISIMRYMEYKQTHPIIYTTEENNKNAVDLGLSVKWATCNVGANSPEEFGNYYCWGEITGEKVKSADYFNYMESQLPKHDIFKGFPSSITNSKFDIAKANWGSKWRLPTKMEAKELIEKCKISEVKELNGICCYKIIGPNGNYIYLPMAGIRSSDGEISWKDQMATIWTGDFMDLDSTINNTDYIEAISLVIETEYGRVKTKWNYQRVFYGSSVRAVMDK